ncbi:MAG TPA: hypothetical protein VGP73_20205 [Thermoanaerobaculia bacterium]
MNAEWLGCFVLIVVVAVVYIFIEALRGSSTKASSGDQTSPIPDDSLLFIQMRAEHEKKLLSMTSVQRQKYLEASSHPFKGYPFFFSNKVVNVSQGGDGSYSILIGMSSVRHEGDLYYLFIDFKSNNPIAANLNKDQVVWVKGYAVKLDRESDKVERTDYSSFKIYHFNLSVKAIGWGIAGSAEVFN